MANQLDTDKLSHAIRLKRGSNGLREAAKEIGEISYTTLSRIEQGNVPDVDTFIRICKWLEMPTDAFIIDGEPEQAGSNKKLVALLRSDQTLPRNVAEALIEMIGLAYKQKLAASPSNHSVKGK